MTGRSQNATARSSKMNAVKKEFKKNYVLYILCIIPLAYLIIFKYMPMYGILMAFKDYKITKGIIGSAWVGLKWFQKFINYYQFKQIMWNTIRLNLVQLLTFPCSLILALMLNCLTMQRYKKIIQTVSYAPHFLSTVIMCGLVIQFLDARSGMINAFLGLFGVPAQNYMGYPEAFDAIYVLSGLWQGLGYSSIIYIAALSGVSADLHEAAIIDGANILQRMWHIDIPSVLPTFCILLIMRCGSLMGSDFEKILLLQNDLNKSVSNTISIYTYQVGLQSSGIPQYSYGAAIGLFTNIINIMMLTIVNTVSKKLTNNGLF